MFFGYKQLKSILTLKIKHLNQSEVFHFFETNLIPNNVFTSFRVVLRNKKGVLFIHSTK